MLNTGDIIGQSNWADKADGTGYYNVGGFATWDKNQSVSSY